MNKILTKKWWLIVIILFTTGYSLAYILNIFLADVAYSKAKKLQEFGFSELSILELKKATRLNFHEPRYHRELAYTYTTLALETRNTSLRENYIENANQEAQIAYRLNPKNSLTLRSIINIYSKLARMDEKYQEVAEKLIQEAIDFIPTDSVLRSSQGKIFILGEKNEAALNSFDEALLLKPDYREAKYAKGLSLAAMKRYQEAAEIFMEIGEIEKAEEYKKYVK